MAISKIKSNSLQDDIQMQGQTVKLPVGEQVDRPVGDPTTYLKGQYRFNNTSKKVELHDGSKWDLVPTQSLTVALGIALGG